MKLTWRGSYETIKFNTLDGDLGEGQYARHPRVGYYVRRHPKNNFQFLRIEELNPDIDKVEVQISGLAYYDEFMLPDNRIYRVPITEKKYRDYAVKGAEPASIDLKESDMTAIKKDDAKWANIPIGDAREEKYLKEGGIQNGFGR